MKLFFYNNTILKLEVRKEDTFSGTNKSTTVVAIKEIRGGKRRRVDKMHLPKPHFVK